MDSSNAQFHDTTQVRREIRGTCQATYDAWIDPVALESWMGLIEAEIDPAVGGKFQFREREGDVVLEHSGQYQVLSQSKELVFSWQDAATQDCMTIVSVEFRPGGAGCDLVLTHQRLPSSDAVEHFTGKWTAFLSGLAAHVEESSPRS